jgi:hypothetical protein
MHVEITGRQRSIVMFSAVSAITIQPYQRSGCGNLVVPSSLATSSPNLVIRDSISTFFSIVDASTGVSIRVLIMLRKCFSQRNRILGSGALSLRFRVAEVVSGGAQSLFSGRRQWM